MSDPPPLVLLCFMLSALQLCRGTIIGAVCVPPAGAARRSLCAECATNRHTRNANDEVAALSWEKYNNGRAGSHRARALSCNGAGQLGARWAAGAERGCDPAKVTATAQLLCRRATRPTTPICRQRQAGGPHTGAIGIVRDLARAFRGPAHACARRRDERLPWPVRRCARSSCQTPLDNPIQRRGDDHGAG